MRKTKNKRVHFWPEPFEFSALAMFYDADSTYFHKWYTDEKGAVQKEVVTCDYCLEWLNDTSVPHS